MKTLKGFAILNVLLILFSHGAISQCACPLRDGNFEEAQELKRITWWKGEGSAGVEFKKSQSYAGSNNGWVRSETGRWNAIKQAVHLEAGFTYTLTAFIKTSDNVRDGYFGFRDASQHPVSEIKFGQFNA